MTMRRRELLAAAGALGWAALLEACGAGPREVGGLLRRVEAGNERLERALFRHTAMQHVGAAAPVAGRGLPSYFISERVPVWDASVHGPWALEVGGLVRTPLRLALADLRGLPSVTQKVEHICVEGWSARVVRTGVPVRDLAALAGADRAARVVDFASFDADYHESWDIESAMHPQTLVVHAQDGQPLDPATGAPARVHSPVKLGYKNTKYLVRLMFLPERNGGYWSDEGYEWYGGL
ncbi:MAG: molybdopterin-dependent oxidoreductase [Gemmatimonadales bacterium]|nr:molybdopterin-dependent oxidoreductase [Gemmatimonadales bacterium]